MSVQIWPTGQVGHLSSVGGHCTQRLKIVRTVFSTAVVVLVLQWSRAFRQGAVPSDTSSAMIAVRACRAG